MILIADGGSTKSSWCLIDNGAVLKKFETEGYNPYFASQEYIVESLNNTLPADVQRSEINQVFYYGSGCSATGKKKIVEDAMSLIFDKATIYINHDLLAAARALLGNEKGFAAILGTGTNTCLYDGNDILLNIDSLGWILGDEGSGTAIGKRLLKDFMRKYMPLGLAKAFEQNYQLSNEEILLNIYNKPLANRFCASFSKFLSDNKSQYPDYCNEVIEQVFDTFFKDLVCHYPNYQTYSFNCVGSIAFNFQETLSLVASRYQMPMGKIIKAPIDGLVEYHLKLS